MVQVIQILPNKFIAPSLIYMALLIDLLFTRVLHRFLRISLVSITMIFLLCSIIQVYLFIYLKNNNLYQSLGISRTQEIEAQYQQYQQQSEQPLKQIYSDILSNPERLIYYEKYHEVTPQLDIIRNLSYENESILKSLSFYMVLIMLCLQVTEEKRFHQGRNLILSLIFLGFVYEAQLILNPQISYDRVLQNNFTQKEYIMIIKILFLNVMILIKNSVFILSKPLYDKATESLRNFQNACKEKQQNQLQSTIQNLTSQIGDHLKKIIDLENFEDKDGYFSTASVGNALKIMTFIVLFTGNYEE